MGCLRFYCSRKNLVFAKRTEHASCLLPTPYYLKGSPVKPKRWGFSCMNKHVMHARILACSLNVINIRFFFSHCESISFCHPNFNILIMETPISMFSCKQAFRQCIHITFDMTARLMKACRVYNIGMRRVDRPII